MAWYDKSILELAQDAGASLNNVVESTREFFGVESYRQRAAKEKAVTPKDTTPEKEIVTSPENERGASPLGNEWQEVSDRPVRIIDISRLPTAQESSLPAQEETNSDRSDAEPDIELAPGDEFVTPEYEGIGGYAKYFEGQEVPPPTTVVPILEQADIKADNPNTGISTPFNSENYAARPFPQISLNDTAPDIAEKEILSLAKSLIRGGPLTVERGYRSYIIGTDKFMAESISEQSERIDAYLSENGIDTQQTFDPSDPDSLKGLLQHIHALASPEQAHDPNIARFTNTVLDDYFSELNDYGQSNRPLPLNGEGKTPAEEIQSLAGKLQFFEKNTLGEAYGAYLKRSPLFMNGRKWEQQDESIASYATENGLDPNAEFDLNDPQQLTDLMVHIHAAAYPQWSDESSTSTIRATIQSALSPEVNQVLAPAQ